MKDDFIDNLNYFKNFWLMMVLFAIVQLVTTIFIPFYSWDSINSSGWSITFDILNPALAITQTVFIWYFYEMDSPDYYMDSYPVFNNLFAQCLTIILCISRYWNNITLYIVSCIILILLAISIRLFKWDMSKTVRNIKSFKHHRAYVLEEN